MPHKAVADHDYDRSPVVYLQQNASSTFSNNSSQPHLNVHSQSLSVIDNAVNNSGQGLELTSGASTSAVTNVEIISESEYYQTVSDHNSGISDVGALFPTIEETVQTSTPLTSAQNCTTPVHPGAQNVRNSMQTTIPSSAQNYKSSAHPSTQNVRNSVPPADSDATHSKSPGGNDKKRSTRPAHSGGNERNQCSYCEKTFSRRDVMLNHEKLHTGLGLFKWVFFLNIQWYLS